MTALHIGRFMDRHARDVAALCSAEGWASWSDERAVLDALTAPGVVALVASEGDAVVGAIEVLTDMQASWMVAMLVVAGQYRWRGVGRELLQQAAVRAHAPRLDVLAEGDGPLFYRALGGREMAGFRLHPEQMRKPDSSGDHDAASRDSV